LWLVLLAVGLTLAWIGWGLSYGFRYHRTDRWLYESAPGDLSSFGWFSVGSMFAGPILVAVAVLWGVALAVPRLKSN
jgi:hypothetical protein